MFCNEILWGFINLNNSLFLSNWKADGMIHLY